MNMKLLLSLALVASAAHADPRVDAMTANCNEVMDSGVCRVALDPRDYPNATIPIILPSGVRRIDKGVYLAIRATGFAKDKEGRWLMCLKVAKACEQWDSDSCLAVRSLWRY